MVRSACVQRVRSDCAAGPVLTWPCRLETEGIRPSQRTTRGRARGGGDGDARGGWRTARGRAVGTRLTAGDGARARGRAGVRASRTRLHKLRVRRVALPRLRRRRGCGGGFAGGLLEAAAPAADATPLGVLALQLLEEEVVPNHCTARAAKGEPMHPGVALAPSRSLELVGSHRSESTKGFPLGL